MSELTLVGTLLPVDDLGAAVLFYSRLLDCAPTFVDGDRYAQFDTAGGRVALLSGTECFIDRTALACATSDLLAGMTFMRSVGGTVLREPVDGPHEQRCVMVDASGNALVLSGPLPSRA